MPDSEGVPLTIVSGLYEAALEPALWGEVLTQVQRHLGASASLLWQEDVTAMDAPFVAMQGLDPARMTDYYDHYIQLDPFFNYRLGKPVGTMSVSHHVLGDAELRESEFYRDFLRHLNVHYTAGVMLERNGARVASFGIMRPQHAGPFNDLELTRMRRLVPHLTRGYQIGQLMAVRELERQALLVLLERLPTGVLLLDERGRVAFLNRRAEQMLAAADGLRMTTQGIAASSPALNGTLERLIHESVETGAGRAEHAGGSLELPVPAGKVPYHVTVTPLRTERTRVELGRSRICAAIFVQLRDAAPALDADALRELFHLTPAETRVALALAQGRAPEDIARSSQASRFTVRAQLSAIYEKLGVHRQAEAVQRMLSSPAALSGPQRDGHEER